MTEERAREDGWAGRDAQRRAARPLTGTNTPDPYLHPRQEADMGCSPHEWKTPKPGDSALECETCDRVMDRAEATANSRSAIIRRISKTRGEDELMAFIRFFVHGLRLKIHEEG